MEFGKKKLFVPSSTIKLKRKFYRVKLAIQINLRLLLFYEVPNRLIYHKTKMWAREKEKKTQQVDKPQNLLRPSLSAVNGLIYLK